MEDANVSGPPQDQGYQASLTDESLFTDGGLLGEAGSVYSSFTESHGLQPFRKPDGLRNVLTHRASNLERGLETDFRMIQPPGFQQERLGELFLVFDMRTDSDCVKGNRHQLPQDRMLAGRALDMNPDHIWEIPNHVGGSQALILGPKQTEKYLLIKASSRFYCLRLRENYDADKIAEQLKQIRDCEDDIRWHRRLAREILSDGVSDLQSDSFIEDNSLTLLFNKQYIDVSDMNKLPSLSLVEVVRNFPVIWLIYHRHTLFCDKRYHVECNTLDTLEDVKQKFLDLYNVIEATGLSTDDIWFTQQNNLISDKLLKQTCDSIFTQVRSPGEMVVLSEHQALVRLRVDRGNGMACIDDVFVHFQPQDATGVQIVHPSHKSEVRTLIVVSPQISASELRDEVSKVVRKEPNGIRISVGRTKLTSKIDLSKALKKPGCKLHVTLKAKITLDVHVEWIPPGTEEKTEFTIPVYSYDSVQVMKAELCKLTGVNENVVDLYLERRPLAKDKTFSDYRIRDNDKIEARIFPNRLRLSVRMPNRRWYDVLVDDSFASTAGHVKTLAQNLGGHETIHECELTVIVNDRVASDTEILGDIRTELGCVPKLVVVKIENVCFTSATAYKETFAVFSSTDGQWFQQFLVMFNGEELFPGPVVSQADGKVASLLQKRRCAPKPSPTVPGIRIVPHRQKNRLADRQNRMNTTHICPSPTSSSQTSDVSTPKLDVWEECAVAHNATPSEEPRVGVGFSDDTNHQGSVRFHTGNSISDMGCLNDEQTPTPKEQQSEAKTEEGDTETLSGKEDEERQQRRARRRNKLSAADGGTAPDEMLSCVQRSGSWPPFTTDLRLSHLPSITTLTQRSGSEVSVTRKELNRTTIINESCQQNQDGTWTVSQTTSCQARVTPDLLPTLATSPTLPALPGGGQVVQYQDQQSQTTAFPDPAYRHMNEKLIRRIAHYLGNNGLMIIRELGVTQDTINQANAAYPKEPQEMFLFCLRAWCQKTGRQASKADLKKALETYDRRDLAEMIDEIDPDPTE